MVNFATFFFYNSTLLIYDALSEKLDQFICILALEQIKSCAQIKYGTTVTKAELNEGYEKYLEGKYGIPKK